MLRCVWREAIHDAGAAQAARGGVAQRQALCRQRGAGAAAAGRRQPGPGLAVRPVCFRRLFGVLEGTHSPSDDAATAHAATGCRRRIYTQNRSACSRLSSTTLAEPPAAVALAAASRAEPAAAQPSVAEPAQRHICYTEDYTRCRKYENRDELS